MKFVKFLIWSSSLFALFLSIAAAGAQTQGEIHKGCATCHEEPDYKAIKAKGSEACLKCHPASLGRDHSIGVVPRIIPADLPLGEGSKITCITCHEPHGKTTVGRLLRKDFNSLCITCHKK